MLPHFAPLTVEGRVNHSPFKVWFTGSTALVRGQLLCLDFDRGTSTSKDADRAVFVELPKNGNEMFPVGVTRHKYDAVSGGQWVSVDLLGSITEIAVGNINLSIGDHLTATAGNSASGTGPCVPSQGMFLKQGFEGGGTAVLLQASPSPSLTLTEGVIATSFTGTGSCTSAGVITDTGKGTYVKAGDRVLVLGGATSGADSSVVTPGEYAVASSDDNNTITLSSSPASSTALITYIVIRGYPTMLAYLQPASMGMSGLVEFFMTDGGVLADDLSVNGWTYFMGGITLDAPLTGEFPEGTIYGQKKAFEVIGDIGNTADIDIDLAVHGIQRTDDDTTGVSDPLGAFTLDDVDDTMIMEWMGQWRTIAFLGGGAQAQS